MTWTRHPAIVVMGVAGCGKTTIAERLGARLGWPVADADDFHSAANVSKMSAGTPLTDADRWPWLESIRDWLSATASVGSGAIVTCSALRRTYRDVLRLADADVVFVHLDGSRGVIAERMAARRDHFMPPALLQSQMETLEPLEPDERGVVIPVEGTPEEITDQTVAALGLARRG